MSYYDQVQAAAGSIRRAVPAPIQVGVVLGSGLGDFADRVGEAVVIPYDKLPHWPASRVVGHEGKLVCGRVKGRMVAALAGRAHAYEGHDMQTVTFAVRALGVLGVPALILTNAAGGIDPGLDVGTLMVIDDHINLTGQNPLVGLNDDRLGPRFPDMRDVYSPRLRSLADIAGRAIGRALPHGVYAGLLGPSYETPAEIRFLRLIGADVVGMSTVAEAIVARQMGIEVLGLSCVTNMAAGVLPQPIAHNDVLETTRRVRGELGALLEGVIERI
jgi:purine-nucleoside phosphorylase